MEQWIVFSNGVRGIMKGMVVYADSMDDAKQKANTLKPFALYVFCSSTRSLYCDV